MVAFRGGMVDSVTLQTSQSQRQGKLHLYYSTWLIKKNTTYGQQKENFGLFSIFKLNNSLLLYYHNTVFVRAIGNIPFQ